jgi:hypothetical protein
MVSSPSVGGFVRSTEGEESANPGASYAYYHDSPDQVSTESLNQAK